MGYGPYDYGYGVLQLLKPQLDICKYFCICIVNLYFHTAIYTCMILPKIQGAHR